MNELIKVLAICDELNTLSRDEKLKLIEEFQSTLPGVTMIIEKSIEPKTNIVIESEVVDMEISNEPDLNTGLKTQSENPSNNINNHSLSVKEKEKWCGQSKEQFTELLKIRQEKSSNLSFKNKNWYLNEDHFKIKIPNNLNNTDKIADDISKKSE